MAQKNDIFSKLNPLAVAQLIKVKEVTAMTSHHGASPSLRLMAAFRSPSGSPQTATSASTGSFAKDRTSSPSSPCSSVGAAWLLAVLEGHHLHGHSIGHALLDGLHRVCSSAAFTGGDAVVSKDTLLDILRRRLARSAAGAGAASLSAAMPPSAPDSPRAPNLSGEAVVQGVVASLLARMSQLASSVHPEARVDESLMRALHQSQKDLRSITVLDQRRAPESAMRMAQRNRLVAALARSVLSLSSGTGSRSVAGPAKGWGPGSGGPGSRSGSRFGINSTRRGRSTPKLTSPSTHSPSHECSHSPSLAHRMNPVTYGAEIHSATGSRTATPSSARGLRGSHGRHGSTHFRRPAQASPSPSPRGEDPSSNDRRRARGLALSRGSTPRFAAPVWSSPPACSPSGSWDAQSAGAIETAEAAAADAALEATSSPGAALLGPRSALAPTSPSSGLTIALAVAAVAPTRSSPRFTPTSAHSPASAYVSSPENNNNASLEHDASLVLVPTVTASVDIDALIEKERAEGRERARLCVEHFQRRATEQLHIALAEARIIAAASKREAVSKAREEVEATWALKFPSVQPHRSPPAALLKGTTLVDDDACCNQENAPPTRNSATTGDKRGRRLPGGSPMGKSTGTSTAIVTAVTSPYKYPVSSPSSRPPRRSPDSLCSPRSPSAMLAMVRVGSPLMEISSNNAQTTATVITKHSPRRSSPRPLVGQIPSAVKKGIQRAALVAQKMEVRFGVYIPRCRIVTMGVV